MATIFVEQSPASRLSSLSTCSSTPMYLHYQEHPNLLEEADAETVKKLLSTKYEIGE
jgi:hypothetical protein